MNLETAALLSGIIRQTRQTTIAEVDCWQEEFDPDTGATITQSCSYLEGSVCVFRQEADDAVGIYFYQGDDIHSAEDWISLVMLPATDEECQSSGIPCDSDEQPLLIAILDDGNSMPIARHPVFLSFMEGFDSATEGRLTAWLREMNLKRQRHESCPRSAVITHLLLHLGSIEASH